MSLQSSDEKNTIGYEKAKPEVEASGFASGPGKTGLDSEMSPILSGPPNYDNRGLRMSSPVQGFIKLSRQALALVENDVDAFVLLTVIALRAHRDDHTFSTHNLKENQAFLGKDDAKKFGLTEQRYRDTKNRIEQRHRLATFKGTNKGTIATLTSTAIYDINSDSNNAQKNAQRTREGTEQERDENAPRTPNKKKEEEKEEEPKEKIKKEKSDFSNPVQAGKKNYREWVSLTEQEHQTLLEKYGAAFTNAMLDAVDSHNTKRQSHYASDYGPMKKGGWAFEQAKKQEGKPHETSPGSHPKTPERHYPPVRPGEFVRKGNTASEHERN